MFLLSSGRDIRLEWVAYWSIVVRHVTMEHEVEHFVVNLLRALILNVHVMLR